MKHTRDLLVVAALAVGGASVLAGCPIARNEPIEPIKIGVLSPLTGGLSGLGSDWKQAAQLAAEQINSSGGLFAGRPLELVIKDTETAAEPSAIVTREAIDDDGVVAIVGPAASSNVANTVEITAAANVPQVSCCATSVTLTQDQRDQQGWFFRTAPNDKLQGKALAHLASGGFAGPHANYTGEGPGERIDSCVEMIVIHRDDSYGSALADVLTQEFEGRPIFERDIVGAQLPVDDPSGEQAKGRVLVTVPYASDLVGNRAYADAAQWADILSDFEGALSGVETAFNDLATGHDFVWNPPVCVVIIGFPVDGAASLDRTVATLSAIESERQNIDPSFTLSVTYLGTDGLFDGTFAAAATALAPLMVGTSPTHAENEAYQKFDSAYRARFIDSPKSFTANVFDGVMLLGLAITRSESTDGASIRDALFEVSKTGQRFDGKFFGEMAEALLRGDDIDYVGPSGELDFDDAGDVLGDYALWRGTSLDGNTYGVTITDFLPAADFNQ